MPNSFSDLSRSTPDEPLVSLDKVKEWFGVTESYLDVQLSLASEAVSAVIRSYTGRYLTQAEFTETWLDSVPGEPLVQLREYPLENVLEGATIYRKSSGQVIREGSSVRYTAGYANLPADLSVIVFELIRQQMYLFGHEKFGTAASAPKTPRSVAIGNLKVDFGAPATSNTAAVNLAKGAGSLTQDALAPYEQTLNGYRSNFAMVTT